MKIRKVISGGQTGADRAGLECARELGIATGGQAPKGYRTEKGTDISLKDFGLTESWSESYPPRTKQNARDADATVWFGSVTSAGYWCTKRAAEEYRKPFLVNPTDAAFIKFCEEHEVINVAGNRASNNPMVITLVKTAFRALKGALHV